MIKSLQCLLLFLILLKNATVFSFTNLLTYDLEYRIHCGFQISTLVAETWSHDRLPVAYITKGVNSGLAKLTLKFNDELVKLGLTTLVK